MPEITWEEIVSGANEGFELIPPSTYQWQITAATAGQTSTNKPRIRVKCVILSGPLAGKPAWKDLVFAEDNKGLMSIRIQELEAVGIDPNVYSGTLEAVVEQVAPALVNRTFTAPLTHGSWQGALRNEIGIFKKSGGAAPAGPPTNAATVPAPTQAPATAVPPPPPATTDETPF